MKRISRLWTALAIATVVLMLGAPPSWAADPLPGSGIAGTLHDFSTAGPMTPPGLVVGECTFCHTPHSGLSTLLLWNQKLSSNTFSWDVPATTSGTSFATFSGLTYKGASAKCLSCHDGSVAVGDYNLFAGNGMVGTPNTLTIAPLTGIYQKGPAGAMKGNHPVAMPYPYQQAQNTYNGVTTGAAFTPTEWQMTPVAPVVLYNDDGKGDISGGPVTNKSGMECSSCHDPHNKAAVDNFFLLGMLVGHDTTYICMKCHIK